MLSKHSSLQETPRGIWRKFKNTQMNNGRWITEYDVKLEARA